MKLGAFNKAPPSFYAESGHFSPLCPQKGSKSQKPSLRIVSVFFSNIWDREAVATLLGKEKMQQNTGNPSLGLADPNGGESSSASIGCYDEYFFGATLGGVWGSAGGSASVLGFVGGVSANFGTIDQVG